MILFAMTEVEHPDCLGGPNFEPDLIVNGRLTRLCKGAKMPQPSKSQKQQEALSLKLMKQQLKASKKPVEMPSFEMPEMPAAPPPAPPPPPGAMSSDVMDSEQEARRKASKRTNYGSGTIFAGETGGYLGGQKTLLG